MSLSRAFVFAFIGCSDLQWRQASHTHCRSRLATVSSRFETCSALHHQKYAQSRFGHFYLTHVPQSIPSGHFSLSTFFIRASTSALRVYGNSNVDECDSPILLLLL